MTLQKYFAPCPRGLEHLLVQELEAINAQYIQATNGGVMFSGDQSTMYQANLHSRIATRILLLLKSQAYRTEQDIYQIASSIPWSAYFDVKQSIKVEINAIKCPLRSLDFIALRIKDAVCDYFRDLQDDRPNVDTSNPDIKIYGFLTENEVKIYIDTSGEALFKRGWRVAKGKAPLRENLAAGLVMLSGWKPDQALLDPMCGSGTIIIEAAMIAAKIPPGINRKFAFENMRGFDQKLWQTLKQNVQIDPTPRQIYGSDVSHHAVDHLAENLEQVNLPFPIAFVQHNVLEVDPPTTEGVIICNPPYGERIDVTSAHEGSVFFKQWADHLKQQFSGWHVYILTSDRDTPKYMRLSPSKKIPLFNGALDCRLFEFKMIAGSARKPKESPAVDIE